ncbi:hypothetical protein M5D96_005193, partial [Drosophila gunungcola]
FKARLPGAKFVNAYPSILTKIQGLYEVNGGDYGAIGAAKEAQGKSPIREVDEPPTTVKGIHHAADDAAGEETGQDPSIEQPDQAAFPLLPLRSTEGARIIVVQRELGALELLLQGQTAGLLALVTHDGGWVDASSASLD